MKLFHYLSFVIMLVSAWCCTEVKEITVVPYPNEVEIQNGTFNAAGAGIHYDPEFVQFAKDAIVSFGGQLSSACGKASQVAEGCSD